MICYDLVLFAAICSFFVLFAAVCRCFLRCVAACAFCYLYSPKMVPKCSPEASKYLQNWPKIDPKLPPGALWAPQVEPKSYFVVLGSILEPNLVPLGTPKSTKNRYFARKMLKEARFQTNVCLARCITSVFIPFFGHFWSKNDEKIITLLCFLLVFPTLEKPCILQATLLVDSVFANMLKCWKSGKKKQKKNEKMKVWFY